MKTSQTPEEARAYWINHWANISPALKPDVAGQVIRLHGSIRAAARATGIAYSTLQNYYEGDRVGKVGRPTVGERSGKTAVGCDDVGSGGTARKTYEDGAVHPKKTKRIPRPRSGVKRFLLTSAQNNTRVHPEFWKNLQAFASYVDAEIHVSRFTYKKSAYKAQHQKDKSADGPDLWWDPAVIPFLSDKRLEIAPGLIWCADLDILPTAKRPLSGLESYTGRASGVFPHTKIAMEPVASGKHEGAKHNYTTGTVTQRNYIQRKAGMQADFHHCYGALLVEVDHHGTWFARQVNADSDGSFQELDIVAANGSCSSGHPVDSIYWGDGHDAEANEPMVALAFDDGGIKDTLKPAADFIGDVLSFKSRSHHDMKDPHVMFQRKQQGLGDVAQEVRGVDKWFTQRMLRKGCLTYSVYGNHERHLGRWLKEADGRFDPVNAIFWSQMQAATFHHIKYNQNAHMEPNYLWLAFQVLRLQVPNNLHFLMEDEITLRCEEHGGGVRCDIHGDRGANGARGTPMGFTKSGRKLNIGDKHSAGIWDGVYVAGTFEEIDNNDWTRGDGSWSYSHIVTYPNGKRAIITCYDGKWRA